MKNPYHEIIFNGDELVKEVTTYAKSLNTKFVLEKRSMSKEYNTAARPFRVWDFNTKTWAGDGVDLYLTTNGTVVIPMKNEDSDFRVENIAVQQFTGRLDVKGIYIYEGSHVAAYWIREFNGEKIPVRGYVQYDPYNCYYYVDKEVEEGCFEERFLFRDLYNITVLGNMFEEEVLKKKV